MDKEMFDRMLNDAETRLNATRPGTQEHADAFREFIELGKLATEFYKVDEAAFRAQDEIRLREVEERERRRLDEKKMENEADAKLKEILVEDRKLRITPGMIFQAASAAAVTLLVLNYEKTGIITTKAFNNWFRKVI